MPQETCIFCSSREAQGRLSWPSGTLKVGKTPSARHFPICYRSVWTKAQIICMNTTGKRPSKAEGLSASTWKGFVKSWQAGLEKAISLQQRFPVEMVLSEKPSEHTVNRMLAAYTHTHDLLHHLQDDFFSCKKNPMDKIPSWGFHRLNPSFSSFSLFQKLFYTFLKPCWEHTVIL